MACLELAPGGSVLFSVERHTGDEDFVLQKSERFAHTDAYIQRVVAAAGLGIVKRRDSRLRKDEHGWIEGTLYQLQRA